MPRKASLKAAIVAACAMMAFVPEMTLADAQTNTEVRQLATTEGVVELDLTLPNAGDRGRETSTSARRAGGSSALFFDLDPDDMPHVLSVNGEFGRLLPGAMSWRIANGSDSQGLFDQLVLSFDPWESNGYELVVFADAKKAHRLFNVVGLESEFETGNDQIELHGQLVLAEDLAGRLGISDQAGDRVGSIVVTARTRVTQTETFDENGDVSSVTLEAASSEPSTAGGFPTEGPDVIVGGLGAFQQYGRVGDFGNGIVGLSVSTTSCNKGNQSLHWEALPDVDHPLILMNLYRLKTVAGSPRFEQLGGSWLKHAFAALTGNVCGFGCTSPGTAALLGVGCSDPYSAGLNAGQCGLGSRSFVNPYTGEFPGEGEVLPAGGGCSLNYPSKDHTGHVHTGVSHRLEVYDIDLLSELNQGARYFAESTYVAAHEYTAGNGNQNNNASWREYERGLSSTTTPPTFIFDGTGYSTVREQAAIFAWEGARRSLIEPAPGEDGIGYLGYEVTDLGNGWWHYEYAVENQNMDRSIGSFSVPVPPGVEVINVDFHQPLHHAPELHEEVYSDNPWTYTRNADSVTWSTTPYATDPLANAIRYAWMYTFRFDANAEPEQTQASIGLFKTGDSVQADADAPAASVPVMTQGSAFNSFTTHAFSGYVDPRMESTNGVDANEGLNEVTLRFTTPVEDIGGDGELTAEGFTVRQTGGGTPPQIVAVLPDETDPSIVRLHLSRPLTPGQWTTIKARVESLSGIPIPNEGDLGPGVDEQDRIDIGFLPCDVDQNGIVQPLDLLRFRQIVAGTFEHPKGMSEDYVDTDRSGGFSPVDLLRFRQLWAGTGSATQAWQGATLPPQP